MAMSFLSWVSPIGLTRKGLVSPYVFCPFFQFRHGNPRRKSFSFFQNGTGARRFQMGVGVSHAATAGGGERNNGFAGQIILLQKRIDDSGRDIPPDGEAEKNGRVSVHVFHPCP